MAAERLTLGQIVDRWGRDAQIEIWGDNTVWISKPDGSSRLALIEWAMNDVTLDQPLQWENSETTRGGQSMSEPRRCDLCGGQSMSEPRRCDLCGHPWAHHLSAISECALADGNDTDQSRPLRPE